MTEPRDAQTTGPVGVAGQSAGQAPAGAGSSGRTGGRGDSSTRNLPRVPPVPERTVAPLRPATPGRLPAPVSGSPTRLPTRERSTRLPPRPRQLADDGTGTDVSVPVAASSDGQADTGEIEPVRDDHPVTETSGDVAPAPTDDIAAPEPDVEPAPAAPVPSAPPSARIPPVSAPTSWSGGQSSAAASVADYPTGQFATYRPEPREAVVPPPRPTVPVGSSYAPGGRQGARPRRGSTRRARLRLSRIDPWSALKVSLVFAAFLFVVWIVAVIVLFAILNGAGVFDSVNSTLSDVLGTHINFSGAVIVGGAAVIGALSVVIVTALGTIIAFAYNLTATLLGGLDVTLTESD